MDGTRSEEGNCIQRYKIYARPNSKFERVDHGGDEIVVYTRSPPDKGKANKSIIKLLAKHFNVKSSRIQIIRGHSSSTKIIDVDRC